MHNNLLRPHRLCYVQEGTAMPTITVLRLPMIVGAEQAMPLLMHQPQPCHRQHPILATCNREATTRPNSPFMRQEQASNGYQDNTHQHNHHHKKGGQPALSSFCWVYYSYSAQ